MNRTYILLILVFLHLISRAGTEESTNTIRLNTLSSQVLNSNVIEVSDNKYNTMFNMQPSSTWGFTNYKSDGRIILKIDQAYPFIVNNYSARVKLSVYSWYLDGSQMVDSTLNPDHYYLSVSQDNTTAESVDYQLQKIANAIKIKTVIDTVWINGIVAYPNGSGTIYPNLVLNVEQQTERYYSLPLSIVWYSMGTAVDYDQDGIMDELQIHWSYIPGIEEYELEWQFVNDYDTISVSTPLSPSNVNFDFTNNGTKVRIVNNFYSIPLVFDRGYIIWRIRGVNKTGPSFANDKFTAWSSWGTGKGTLNGLFFIYDIYFYYNSIAHQGDKPWQTVSTFAEEGKNKILVNYMDGTLRSRQKITQENTNGDVIVGETFYDYQGRAAVEALPAPSFSNALKFYPKFNRSYSDTTKVYDKTNFDLNVDSCSVLADKMSDYFGTARYYSANNPDTTLYNSYIPRAKGYPFVQTEFEPDNTGRIRAKGGADSIMQIGVTNGKYTTYLYSQPDQAQLDKVLFTEAGNYNHYKKNTVVDPNGQASVSYTNLAGKVVISSLAGGNPDNLDVLNNLQDTIGTGVDLLIGNNVVVSTDSMSIHYSKIFEVVGNNIRNEFAYALNDTSYTEACNSACYHCAYDLNIHLTDNKCGSVLFDTTVLIGNKYDYDCSASAQWTYNKLVALNTGTYTLEKTLSINTDAMSHYIDYYLDSTICIPHLDTLTPDTCGCHVTCDSCYAKLGEFEDYKNKLSLSVDSLPPDSILIVQYKYLRSQCDQYCISKSPCDLSLQVLLQDVSIYGQYGQIIDTATGKYTPTSFPLSVFNDHNYLPIRDGIPNWRHPWPAYRDEQGNLSYIEIVNGFPLVVDTNLIFSDSTGRLFTVPQNLDSVKDFTAMWQRSWANSLVIYHPEYPYYTWCKAKTDSVVYPDSLRFKTSNEFDSFLRKIDNINNIPASWISDKNNLLGIDPFFHDTKYICDDQLASHSLPIGKTAKEIMQYFFTYFQKKDEAGTQYYSMDTAAYVTTHHPFYYYKYTLINSSLNTSIPLITGDPLIDTSNFIIYLNNYLSCKEKIKELLSDCYALDSNGYNSCIGSNDFNPYKSKMIPVICRPIIHWYWVPQGGIFSFFLSDVLYWYYTMPSSSLTNCDVDRSRYFLNTTATTPVYQEPCNQYTYRLYSDKSMRFPKATGATKIALGTDNIDDINAQIDKIQAQNDYNIYMKTGQCPITRDLQGMLNAMANRGKLKKTMDTLNYLSQFTKVLYEACAINGPIDKEVNPIYWEYQSGFNSTDVFNTNIKEQIDDNNIPPTISQRRFIELYQPSSSNPIDPDSIKGFTHFKALSASSSNYYFSVNAIVSNNGILQSIIMQGVTDININQCSSIMYSCVPNDASQDILGIINLMTSKADSTSHPFYDEDITMVKTPALYNILGPSSNLYWTKTTSGTAPNYPVTITITNGTTGVSLNINLNGFNFAQNNIFQIYELNPLATTGSFKLGINKFSNTSPYGYTAPADTNCIGTVTISGLPGISALSLMDCGKPTLGSCNSKENKNVTLLQKFLSRLASISHLASSSYNLVPGIAYTNDIRTMFGDTSSIWQATVNSSHGELNAVLTDLATPVDTICRFTLDTIFNSSNPVGLDYTGIDSITGLTPLFLTANASNTSNFFTAYAYKTQNGNVFAYPIRGYTSCLQLRSCVICSPDSAYEGDVTSVDAIYGNIIHLCNFNFYNIDSAAYVDNSFYSSYWGHPCNDPDALSEITDVSNISDCSTCNKDNYSGDYLLNITKHHLSTDDTLWIDTVTFRSNTNYLLRFKSKYCGYKIPPNLTMRLYKQNNTYNEQPIKGNISANWTTQWARFRTQTDTVLNVGIILPTANNSDGYGSLFFDDITILQVCNCTYPDSLEFDTIPYVPDPCPVYLTDVAKMNSLLLQSQLTDSLRQRFQNNYRRTCLKVRESLFRGSNNQEYQYTLYFYDQAGNLVRTVPPAGVTTITNAGQITAIDNARNSGVGNQYQPIQPHTMPTTYKYNSLNQVVKQETPDAGVTRFWYDKKGRLVFSQNSKQLNGQQTGDLYSYTRYDNLGRIIEVGETYGLGLNDNTGFIDLNSAPYNLFEYFDRSQITYTYYDSNPLSVSGLLNVYPGFTQDNTIKRVAAIAVYSNNTQLNYQNYDHATFYSYDIHGNVKSIVQDFPLMGVNRYKRIDYDYDLISGKVNIVDYQPGQPDRFIHRYEYDADNKITHVFTSRDSVIWEKEAKYWYYRHGPLARTEIGDLQVQGIDYAYTLQGWIKGINSNTLDSTRDQGKDNLYMTNNLHSKFAGDLAAYSLGYYPGDYIPANNKLTDSYSNRNFVADNSNINTNLAPGLYNGNISQMVTTIMDATRNKTPQLAAYRYDQLNRITQMRTYNDVNFNANLWNNTTSNHYQENYTYDPVGNIDTLVRADENGTVIDNLTYNYNFDGNSRLINNKLAYITDAATPATTYDIKTQNSGNYNYDAIGNMTQDVSGNITNIAWTVYGKVDSITYGDGRVIAFKYDAMGNRVCKEVIPNNNNYNTGHPTYNYYVRDAQGNIMATYTKSFNTLPVPIGEEQPQPAWHTYLSELELYGSSRIGLKSPNLLVDNPTTTPTTTFSRVLGDKRYEIDNHLGNVLSVFTDKKTPVGVSTITGYTATLVASQDYYPFGMIMNGRNYNTSSYRFGFNGQEKDQEVYNNQSTMTAMFWEYDGRIGRRWNRDPKPTTVISEYVCLNDNPIWNNDLLGDVVDNYKTDKAGNISLIEKTDDNFDVLYNNEESSAIQVDKGVLNKNKTYTTALKDDKNKVKVVPFDVFKIRDDEQGSNLFKFLSQNTNVEWSQFKTGKEGKKGLNFLATTHEEATEAGALTLFAKQLISYTIREHIHNHPHNTDYASGSWDDNGNKAGEWGDVGFAKYVGETYNAYQHNNKLPILKTPIFKIYLPNSDEFITYDKNTRH